MKNVDEQKTKYQEEIEKLTKKQDILYNTYKKENAVLLSKKHQYAIKAGVNRRFISCKCGNIVDCMNRHEVDGDLICGACYAKHLVKIRTIEVRGWLSGARVIDIKLKGTIGFEFDYILFEKDKNIYKLKFVLYHIELTKIDNNEKIK